MMYIKIFRKHMNPLLAPYGVYTIINSLVFPLSLKIPFHCAEKLINKIRDLRWKIYSSLRFVHFDVKVLPKSQETFPITDTPSVQFYTLTNGYTLG